MDNLRRAIVIVSILVLIGAGVIGFMFALDNIVTNVESPVVELSPEGDPYDPSRERPASTASPAAVSDASTMLFVLTDEKGDSAELVFTATADFVSHKISLIFYPVDTSVAVKTSAEASEFKTLAGFYATEGLERLTEAVGGILSLPVKGTVSFKFSDLSNLINAFTSKDNGVSYCPPCNVSAISYDGTAVSFKKETTLFTGAPAARLVGFYRTKDNVYDSETVKYYDGTRGPQNMVAATFADAFVSQKLTGNINAYYSTNYESLFRTFLKDCGGAPASDFPARMAQEHKKFTSDLVDSYVIDTKKDPSGSTLIYAGSLLRTENESGTITAEMISDDKLTQFLKSLY